MNRYQLIPLNIYRTPLKPVNYLLYILVHIPSSDSLWFVGGAVNIDVVLTASMIKFVLKE